jgi:peptide subunit release factor 1 (eRF1)
MSGISRLRKILDNVEDGAPVISVYFPVPHGKDSRKIRKKISKNIAKEIFRRAASRGFDLKSIEEGMLVLYDIFDEIVLDKRGQLTHVIFLSPRFPGVERFEINAELPPLGVVDTLPVLSPLLMALDDADPYLFLFLDGSGGKLSLYRDDTLTWLWEEKGDVPKKVKYGGWYGLESSRITRHVEGYQQKLVKDVVARCQEEVRKQRPEGLILLASSNVYSLAAELLERDFSDLFVRCQNAEISHYTGKEAESAIRELLAEVRVERDMEEIHSVTEGGATGTPPLMRIDEILKALHEGKVRKVVLKRGADYAFNFCESCLLTSLDANACPICGVAMKRRINVAEMIIRLALKTGAEIKFVSRWTLPETTRVAASLRYAA